MTLRVGEDVRWRGRTYVLCGLDPMGVTGRQAELRHPATRRRVRVLAAALERENEPRVRAHRNLDLVDGAAGEPDPVRRQYLLGAYNRRLMATDSSFPDAVLLCTCGGDECVATVRVRHDDYVGIRLSPHRFVVAPGHATAADRLLESRGAYDVVEILPRFREQHPPT
jgi:hypothetical protein